MRFFIAALLCALSYAQTASNFYEVSSCVVDVIGGSCIPERATLQLTEQPVSGNHCEETVDLKGSVTWADLILPEGKALFLTVTTLVSGQNTDQGFFVRPTRKTREWGRAEVTSNSASFYIASTGQYSVEFASDQIWRNSNLATDFDALMLFINPEYTVPSSDATVISPDTDEPFINLGPNQAYVFQAGVTYDWGRDMVFKVFDNTQVYFEPGAYVRARIVQTEQKVDNVLISGYGVLDQHYTPEDEDVGVADDRTRQTISIFGKNIEVFGITMINTNEDCGSWGYCMNINANWSPMPDYSDPFDASELQLVDPPYKPRQAHCQLNNMDDTANDDFSNCPTSYEDGQKVSFIKCMTWQMGQDGVNAGKYSTVENSFVRTIDDGLKVWDSYAIYRNITIWQLPLGWPINFGWWQWNQPDEDSIIEDIYVIHNHNWMSSRDWPTTQSGQCTIGAIYGSGSTKRGYRIRNVFSETAASCAIGLDISKTAYNRHLTPEGCVGSIVDMRIEGMFFDEEFYQTGGYDNFLSGETNPNAGCTGDLSGKIKDMSISGIVAGRELAESDFIIDSGTVRNLQFGTAIDPHPIPAYTQYSGKNAYEGNGALLEMDEGVAVSSAEQCVARCHSDLSCDCVVYSPSDGVCYKRRGCTPESFDSDNNYDVFVRPEETSADAVISTPSQPTATEPIPDFDTPNVGKVRRVKALFRQRSSSSLFSEIGSLVESILRETPNLELQILAPFQEMQVIHSLRYTRRNFKTSKKNFKTVWRFLKSQGLV